MELSLNSGWADKIQGSWAMNQTSPSSTWLSVSDMIKQEEAAEKESQKIKLSDYFNKRSAARKAISSWNITSWNKAQDVMETRMWKLVDLYLDASSKEVDENGKPLFSSEKIIEASKNPNKVLKDMKKYYFYNKPDRAWAIDDYIEKWWIASNVFEYLEDVSWNVTNPYWKVETFGNMFDESTPEVAKWITAVASFLPSMGSNLAGRIMGNKWLRDKSYNTQYKIRDSANDQEYEQYKNWTLPEWNNVNNINVMGESKKKFYDDYTDAQNEWFVGSVDEYKNFRKNIYDATNEAVSNRLKEWLLTEEDMESSKAAIAGDALWELVTYGALPFNKVIKLKWVKPILNEIVNLVVDSTVNTAEISWIEALKNNDMDAWDVAELEGINTLITTLTRSPAIAKYLKEVKNSKTKSTLKDLIARTPDRIKDAYSRLSAEQLQNIKNLTKLNASSSSVKASNAWVRYFGKKWVDAMETSLKEYLAAWDELGKEAQNLRNSWITIDLIESSLNKELKNLENPEVMWNTAWGKWKSPQIHINKKKNWQWTLNIENEANLNMIKNGEGEWLADAMRKIFDGMFGDVKWQAWAGMEFNEATMLAFMNEVKWATQWTEWSWGNMWAKVFWDWLDAFRKNANLPETFLEKEQKYLNKKDLHNALSDAFGSYGKYSSEIDKEVKLFEAWKKLQDKNLQWVLELAQDAGYISDTVDAEIIAYGYMLGLQDEAAMRAFFWNVYPSEPWLIEAVLEWIRNGIREGTIDRYINAKTIENARKQWVGWMAELSNWWREIYKSVSGWADIAKNRLTQDQEEPFADIDMEAFEQWQRSKK